MSRARNTGWLWVALLLAAGAAAAIAANFALLSVADDGPAGQLSLRSDVPGSQRADVAPVAPSAEPSPSPPSPSSPPSPPPPPVADDGRDGEDGAHARDERLAEPDSDSGGEEYEGRDDDD